MRGLLTLALGALLALACAIAPASAQLTLTGAGQGSAAAAGGGGGGGGFAVTWRGHYEDATTRTTTDPAYTATAADLGTASSDRIIVLAVISGASTSSAYGTPTVGGVSMTRANADPAGGTNFAAFWYASVPLGATGDIVVPVTSGTLSRISLDWWSITGSANTAPTTVSNDPARAFAGVDNISTSPFDVPADGVSLALARSNVVSALSTLTCTQTICNTRTNAQTAGESQWAATGDATGSGLGQTWTFATNAGSGSLNIVAIVWEP
ncbi:MAG: hypothetical protein ACOY5Y_06960 [Pseudomonadota bacterium]